MSPLLVICLLALNSPLLEARPSGEDNSTAKRGKPPTCTAQYAAMPESTMCLYYEDSRATDKGISSSERNAIVDLHNLHRRTVSPKAANMQFMYWDEEIAKIAQHYANSCPDEHDGNAARQVPDYGISVGQNLAWGYGTWTSSINGWHGEVKDFQYGVGSKNGGVVGHYTQEVWAHSSRIGCGYAYCTGTKYLRYYVCNYLNQQSDLKKPYKQGYSSCGNCLSKCQNNMCNCGGKICFNGGTLDLNSCTCKCQDMYSGYTCQNKDCPDVDDDICWTPQPYGYDTTECKYSNVPPLCPNMCGVCPNKCPGMTAGKCKNGSKLDINSCDCKCKSGYIGKYCDQYAAGACPQDESYCNQWPASYCTIYYNVPEQCPHLCGQCG